MNLSGRFRIDSFCSFFDRTVLLGLGAKFWTVISGLMMLFFVANFLSPEQQGFYYTFYSLIALQIFVELGLGVAIIQFASHEMAYLSVSQTRLIEGGAIHKARLQSLLRFSVIWFGVAGLFLVFALIPLGLCFFANTKDSGVFSFDISLPWVLLVGITAPVIFLNAALSILEGCNQVSTVISIRFFQSFTSAVVIMAAMYLGCGLYSLPIGASASFLVGGLFLFGKYKSLFVDLWTFKSNVEGINWRSEILPFQWKIAVSWMSGYLIFQMFNPLLLNYHGSVAAGRMGMSLQIIAAMNGAAAVWITTKVPLMGQLIASGNRSLLDRIAFDALKFSLLFLIAGSMAVYFGLELLIDLFPKYSDRVLPVDLFLLLLLVCLSNHIVFSGAAYLRSHKKEPYMGLSVVTAFVTLVLSLNFIPPYGFYGAVYSYLFGSVGISLIGGSFIFFKLHRFYSKSIVKGKFSK